MVALNYDHFLQPFLKPTREGSHNGRKKCDEQTRHRRRHILVEKMWLKISTPEGSYIFWYSQSILWSINLISLHFTFDPSGVDRILHFFFYQNATPLGSIFNYISFATNMGSLRCRSLTIFHLLPICDSSGVEKSWGEVCRLHPNFFIIDFTPTFLL